LSFPCIADRFLEGDTTVFSTWFFGKRKSASSSRRQGQARRPKARIRPQLEILEDRLAPAILTVTSALDDGGPGTLRSVVIAHAGLADTVEFAANLEGKTITLNPGLGPIRVGNLTIQGPGSSESERVTISGNPAIVSFSSYFRIFDLGANQNIPVTLSNLNFINMVSENGLGGGAIELGGGQGSSYVLNLDHCDLMNNVSYDGYGGAIFAPGNVFTVNLNACTLANNSAQSAPGAYLPGPAYGGAICSFNGATVNLTNCTLSNNFVTNNGGGGAIFNLDGSVTLNNCTLSNNTTGTTGGGGAVWNDGGYVSILCSTFSGNSAPVGADLANGRIYGVAGSVTLIGTTIGDIFNDNGGRIITPDRVATNLEAQIPVLTQSGALTADQAAGLTNKVQPAQQTLDNCNLAAGLNDLNALVNQLDAFVKSGTLTAGQAQPLIDGADQLITALNSAGV
jgi:hypothetical protein